MHGEMIRDLHVTLPADLYDRLRSEANRTGHSVTGVARRAIDTWLQEQQRREAIDTDIQSYIERYAGTEFRSGS